MFDSLPSEMIEYILFYLSVADIISVFSAFRTDYYHFSDYFWKALCLREHYIKSYTSQHWKECFLLGANIRLGNFTEIADCPDGKLKHVYLRSLVTSKRSTDIEMCYVHSLDEDNHFNVVQTIEGDNITFDDEFCLVKKARETYIYKYNKELNLFIHHKTLPECFYDIFGICCEYCTFYDSTRKCLKCYEINNDSFREIQLSPDVKFVLSKRFYQSNIAIVTISVSGYYEINLYDISSRSCIVILKCFSSTGITNDPNIWLSSNFIACCDISYRVRGNYFGPFIVWDKKGNELFRKDIQPSSKHYLRCCFTEENIILTTSEDTIKVFNHLGDCVSSVSIDGNGLFDIKIVTGSLLLVMVEGINYMEVFNLIPESFSLYKIESYHNKIFFGHFLCCISSSDSHQFKIIKYL